MPSCGCCWDSCIGDDMNKRERKCLSLHERNTKQDLTEFSVGELIKRAKLQDYLYTSAWGRFERFLRLKQ